LPEIFPASADAPEDAAPVEDTVEVTSQSDSSVLSTDEESGDATDVADDGAETDADAEGDEADE
jgi:hypothetical protein